MLSNRLVFAGLAAACVTAAGAGGYLATRQANQATQAAPAPGPASLETAAPSATAAATDAALPAAGAPAAAARIADATAATPEAASSREVARTRPNRPAAPAARTTVRPPRPADAPAARDTAATTASLDPRPTERQQAEFPRTVPPTHEPQEAGPVPAAPDVAGAPPAATAPPAGEAAPPVDAAPAPPATADNFEELTVAADSVIGLELERPLSSERARVEDRVEARVARNVRVGRSVAIPAGARALGSVMAVERGGKFKERARLGIRFHTLVLADGTRLPIQTETIYRYGEAQGDRTAKKIGGGAVAGAILGAIIGGARGAAVGATAGAGGGTAMVMAGDRSAAEFPAGAEVTARIVAPVTVTVER